MYVGPHGMGVHAWLCPFLWPAKCLKAPVPWFFHLYNGHNCTFLIELSLNLNERECMKALWTGVWHSSALHSQCLLLWLPLSSSSSSYARGWIPLGIFKDIAYHVGLWKMLPQICLSVSRPAGAFRGVSLLRMALEAVVMGSLLFGKGT